MKDIPEGNVGSEGRRIAIDIESRPSLAIDVD
ncbi:hypothetical protein XSR1_110028 [Xenorhabdus szentirmaii DSM 16338]|uniref:Uncharacterized protein n=1 Tax=Xenorhabdus szentirmaii DSM 16338 TaxID=1427518 RepID=W1IV97_9GAMM|nr:hypothetical protein XSR1_110028 [Xenorhabdus szentirmaii DSM 16338]